MITHYPGSCAPLESPLFITEKDILEHPPSVTATEPLPTIASTIIRDFNIRYLELQLNVDNILNDFSYRVVVLFPTLLYNRSACMCIPWKVTISKAPLDFLIIVLDV